MTTYDYDKIVENINEDLNGKTLFNRWVIVSSFYKPVTRNSLNGICFTICDIANNDYNKYFVYYDLAFTGSFLEFYPDRELFNNKNVENIIILTSSIHLNYETDKVAYNPLTRKYYDTLTKKYYDTQNG